MASSTTPPPPKSNNSGYVAAGIGMLIAMGGLIFWKMSGDKAPEPTAPPPKVAEKKPVFDEPPPPPPPVEEVKDAEAEKDTPKKIVKGNGAPTACSGPCDGIANAQLQSALGAKGGQARGCYERALRNNPTLEGRLMIAARLGPQGQVCSANVTSNSLGDPGVASCITQMFRSGKFPAPSGGSCVDVQVPLNFVARK